MNDTPTTYDERAKLQRNSAIEAGAERICELQKKIDDSKDEIESGFVAVVNAMRAQGAELLRMADHEQVSFRFFAPLSGVMPFDFDTAKQRVAIYHKRPQPCKTFEDAREVYRSVLEQMNLLQMDVPGETSRGMAHDPFSIALNSFVLIKQKFLKALMVTPIEKCSRERLKDIVADTQWACEINEQARAALGNP